MSKHSVLVLALLTAAGLSLATQVPVSMIEYAFQPDTVRIGPGDSVIWTNNGAFLHSSTSGVSPVWDSLWESGDLAHGATFVHGFAADGTFPYFCRHHYFSGMKGVVVVGTGVGADESPNGTTFGLKLAAFPSPFRSSTTISYLLPKQCPVTVSVVDITGGTVSQLRSASQNAGSHELVWNGRTAGGKSVPAGVYSVRVEAGGSQLTTRVVLSR
jgi:plastocyanin